MLGLAYLHSNSMRPTARPSMQAFHMRRGETHVSQHWVVQQTGHSRAAQTLCQAALSRVWAFQQSPWGEPQTEGTIHPQARILLWMH